MLVNQKISLKITRGQSNKRRGLEGREKQEKKEENKKTKSQRGGSGRRESHKNWNTPPLSIHAKGCSLKKRISKCLTGTPY